MSGAYPNAQPCSICVHPQRATLEDRALVGAESNRTIARGAGVSEWALNRHLLRHLPRELMLAARAKEVAHGDWLLPRVLELYDRARSVGRRCRVEGKVGGELGALREEREALSLVARMMGELPDVSPVTVAVMLSTTVSRVQSVLARELAGQPELLSRVATALGREADVDG